MANPSKQANQLIKDMKNVFLVAFLVFATAFSALAQTETPRATTRQVKQRARIHEGRTSGELTNGEAAALNAEQRHIKRVKRRAKADGEVTPQEKAKLQRKQNRANRHIRRAKHNGIEQ